MPTTLKHQTKINELELADCPQTNCVPKDCEAFRFCYDTLDHPDTWLTQAEKLARTGTFPRKNSSDAKICDAFGLSFFDSEQNAKAVWKSFSPRTKEKLGYKNLSGGNLLKHDGICSQIELHGHFNLFEFEDCDLKPRFIIISSL